MPVEPHPVEPAVTTPRGPSTCSTHAPMASRRRVTCRSADRGATAARTSVCGPPGVDGNTRMDVARRLSSSRGRRCCGARAAACRRDGGARARRVGCGAPRRVRRRGAAASPSRTPRRGRSRCSCRLPPNAWMAQSIDLARHVGGGDLDHRDLAPGFAIADRVHQVRGLQREQPGLLDGDARLGDPFQRHGLFGDRPTEGDALRGSSTHHLEGSFGEPDQSHAVVDATRPEATLGDLEAASLAEQHVRRRAREPRRTRPPTRGRACRRS